MQNMRAARWTWVLLAAILLFSTTRARLTENGLPNGQTVAPRGADHLHYTLSRTTPQRRRKKGSKGSTRRNRRRLRYTLASTSPFFTLGDSSCMQASHIAVRDNDGWVGVTRTLPAHMLTAVRGGPTFVLFHGGAQCEWSRKFWRVWIEAARRLRGNCLVAVDGARDSMMNYNLMVLGFPTVVRVRTDESRETFRGNRTVDDLVAWVVAAAGIAPMGSVGPRVQDDVRWLAVPHLLDAEGIWQGPVLDIRDEAVKDGEQFNWPLLGANLVCLAHIAWGLFSLARYLRKRRSRRRDGGEDSASEEGSAEENEPHEHID